MQPYLSGNDIHIFNKYMQLAKNYFEFGSGGSTYYACGMDNIKKIYSIESDLRWIDKLKNISLVKNKIDDGILDIIFVDIKNTPKERFGYPGKTSKYSDWIKYSRAINNIDSKIKIDTIMIDGRFRVACALHCFNKIDNDTIILFDDFSNREYYHVLLDYFDIVEQGKDRLAVLKKKTTEGLIPNDTLIQKYERDSR